MESKDIPIKTMDLKIIDEKKIIEEKKIIDEKKIKDYHVQEKI